jgi:type VI secretion system protein ImpF
MTDAFSRDRLQPALLDRLIDDAPGASAEAPEARTLTRQRLRQAVLRDLTWLLNSMSMLDADDDDPSLEHVRRSTVNFGFPPLSGAMTSSLEPYEIEQRVRQSILDFEPRILPESLQVRAIPPKDRLEQRQLIELEISGELWAQPYPLELLLRTEVHLDSGQVEVCEGAVPVRGAR